MKKRMTLQDIADEAGVSLTAASMYINGKAKKYNLAESTCKRIEEVIRKNNFVPNFHARAIASKKTFLVSVIIHGQIDSSFWLNIVSGLEDVLMRKNYHFILSLSHNRADEELQALRFAESKGVDGYIISPAGFETPGDNFEFLRELNQRKPVVTITEKVEGLHGVFNNNYLGGEIATKHLLERGFKQLAYIGSDSRRRARAFADVTGKLGIKAKIFDTPEEYIRSWRKFPGVFCFSDFVACELYKLAEAAGISVGKDISVIGYDDMPFVEYLSPELTTIHQYKRELGTAAAETLLKLLAEKNDVADQIFDPYLVERSSVLARGD